MDSPVWTALECTRGIIAFISAILIFTISSSVETLTVKDDHGTYRIVLSPCCSLSCQLNNHPVIILRTVTKRQQNKLLGIVYNTLKLPVLTLDGHRAGTQGPFENLSRPWTLGHRSPRETGAPTGVLGGARASYSRCRLTGTRAPGRHGHPS